MPLVNKLLVQSTSHNNAKIALSIFLFLSILNRGTPFLYFLFFYGINAGIKGNSASSTELISSRYCHPEYSGMFKIVPINWNSNEHTNRNCVKILAIRLNIDQSSYRCGTFETFPETPLLWLLRHSWPRLIFAKWNICLVPRHRTPIRTYAEAVVLEETEQNHQRNYSRPRPYRHFEYSATQLIRVQCVKINEKSARKLSGTAATTVAYVWFLFECWLYGAHTEIGKNNKTAGCQTWNVPVCAYETGTFHRLMCDVSELTNLPHANGTMQRM